MGKWGQTGAAIALSAYLISRPGACDAALKGASETMGCVKVLLSKFALADENGLGSPISMMRPEAPPNFWERETTEIIGR